MKMELSLETRAGLPDALRVLVDEYPRDGWQAHPNFNAMVQFWLSRHVMFRTLHARLETETQSFLDRQVAFEVYAPRLSHLAGTLLNELHTHHQVEDNHYFPRLMALDDRVAWGFELLDADHHAMDGLLDGAANAANTTLHTQEAGPFLAELERFGRLLDRHLTDEEELVVPVVLSSGFVG